MTTFATPGTARRRGRIVHSAMSRSSSGETSGPARSPIARMVESAAESGDTAGRVPAGSCSAVSARRSITTCRARYGSVP